MISKHHLVTKCQNFGSCSTLVIYLFLTTEPHSSVGSVHALRRGGRLFNPRLGKNSFRGLMIVVVMGFIPLSPLPLFSRQWSSGKSASGLARTESEVLVKRITRKHEYVNWPPRYN